MAPTGRRGFKREQTFGLITPVESFHSAGTVTPKQEREEIDLTAVSDILEDRSQGAEFQSNHGLPFEDEGYSSLIAERQRRSASVSVRTSQPPPSHQERTRAMPPIASLPPRPQGLEFVGSNVKLLVDAINKLRRFGLDHVVQLPELVLVGDQSAGKSSLMSALTEVSLPRDQGICTKCPANITTSPADLWSCKVSLQQYYRYVHPGPRGVDSKSVNKKNPFPPWVEQDLEVKEFKTIYDKSELEEVIKWAQIALLNHDIDHRLFVPGSGRRAQGDFQQEKAIAEAKFSPNVIGVEISGPGLPALSFYDLPGIFRVAPNPRDQYLAKVIENLAIKYITRENALIIWTLAMKTDPSNSSTGKVIQDCHAAQRCVGVLTNPDHVAVRHLEYEKILEKQAHIVKHGYFVTKQPGEDSKLQHGPTYHAEARREEMEFFDSEELWTGDWNRFRKRCGTLAIQKFLSRELAGQIMDSLPDIIEKINARARAVQLQLDECPELPEADIRNVITKNLSQFSSDVRRIMSGDSVDLGLATSGNFQSSWNDLCNTFRDVVLFIKPKITISDTSDTATPDVIEILSDDDDDDTISVASFQKGVKRANPFQDSPVAQRQCTSVSPSPRPSGKFNTIQTPSSGRSMKRENDLMSAPPLPTSRPNPRSNPFAHTPFAGLAHRGKGFIKLREIRQYIKMYTRPGTPLLVNDKAYNELCLQSVTVWNEVLEIFMDETFVALRNQLQEVLHKNLGVYEQTELYRQSQRLLDKYLDELEQAQRQALTDLYRLETYKFFTVHTTAITNHKAKELQGIRSARKDHRALLWVQKQIKTGQRKNVSGVTPEDRRKDLERRAKEVKEEELGPDQFACELEVAAYVRAYYTTTAFRFVDSVCLSVNGNMFRKIDETIHYHLETALGITASRHGEEKCRELMEEDATMGERRRRLKDEKIKLADFAKELNRLVNQIEEMDSMPELANGNSNHFEQMQNGHRGNSNDSERSGVHGESMDLEGNENGGPSAYSSTFRGATVEDANDLPGPDGELF